MANVATLTAKLEADTSGLKRGLASAESDVKGFGGRTSSMLGKLGPMVAIGAAAGAAAVGAMAVKSVAAFAQFEEGMNEVFTLLPGMSEDAMDEMSGQVKDFSKEFGVLPDKVIPSLYQAISAGVPKDNVFEFMEIATKASIGGATELETAVDGLTSVVNAYGSENITAAEASDIMFTAVRLGKTTMDELSQSLFQVNPVAAALGVKFGDVSAALAAMTSQGTPTRVATTQLRSAFVELGKEGTIASDVFKEATGQTFPDFIAGGGTVEDAFNAMKGKADDMGVGVGDLFGSVEAGMGVISLTSGSGAAAFSTNMQQMADSAGATDAAFATMDQGLSRSWDKIKATVSVGMISLGEKLAPFVEKFAKWLEEVLPDAIDFLLDAFDDMTPYIEDIIGMFAAWGPVLKDVAEEVLNVGREVAEAAKPLIDIIAWIGEATGSADEGEQSWLSWGNAISFAGDVVVGAAMGMDRTLLPALIGVTEGSEDSVVAVSGLSDEMLDMKRATHTTEKGVTGSMKDMKSGADDAMTGIGKALEEVSDGVVDSIADWDEWEKELGVSMEDTQKQFFDVSQGIVNIWDGAADQLEITADEMMTNLKESFAQKQEFDALFTALGDAGMFGLQQALLDGGPASVTAIKELSEDSTKAWEANFMLDPSLELARLANSPDYPKLMWAFGHNLGANAHAAFVDGFGTLHIKIPAVTATNRTQDIGIHWNAAGGIAMGPTVLQGLGEAGPEAIVPLDKWPDLVDATSSGGGGDVYVTVEGNLFGAATVDDLAAILTTAQVGQGRRGW